MLLWGYILSSETPSCNLIQTTAKKASCNTCGDQSSQETPKLKQAPKPQALLWFSAFSPLKQSCSGVFSMWWCQTHMFHALFQGHLFREHLFGRSIFQDTTSISYTQFIPGDVVLMGFGGDNRRIQRGNQNPGLNPNCEA